MGPNRSENFGNFEKLAKTSKKSQKFREFFSKIDIYREPPLPVRGTLSCNLCSIMATVSIVMRPHIRNHQRLQKVCLRTYACVARSFSKFFAKFFDVFGPVRTCFYAFGCIQMLWAKNFGQKKIEKKNDYFFSEISRNFSMFSGGLGGARGKRTSKSASASNFAQDTPILRSVRPNYRMDRIELAKIPKFFVCVFGVFSASKRRPELKL